MERSRPPSHETEVLDTNQAAYWSAAIAGSLGQRRDRVQLVSALATREADDDCSWFASFDAELNRAAAAEGFELLSLT